MLLEYNSNKAFTAEKLHAVTTAVATSMPLPPAKRAKDVLNELLGSLGIRPATATA